MSQTWLRERGSRPVVGSSRNISCGRDDDARGDVQPAPHAARVVLDQPARRVGEAERLEQLVGARPAPPARRSPSSRPSRIRFSRPVRSSSTDASWPVRLTSPRTASASRHDVVPEHPGACRRRARSAWRACGSSSSSRRRWARARRRRRPADGEVDAVDGARVAERLHQARGLDRERCVRRHRTPHLAPCTPVVGRDPGSAVK